MKRSIFLLCLFFLMYSFIYSEGDVNDSVTLSHRVYNGVKEIHEITLKKANSLPEWDPTDKKDCPLKIFDAIEKCNKWLIEKNPKMDSFLASEIKLSSISHPSVKNKWFYTITFDPVINKRRIPGSFIFVVILTDGEIVESVQSK